MPDAALLQYGALGLVALFIGIALPALFKRADKSTDFAESVANRAIDTLESLNKQSSDTNRRVAEELKRVGDQIEQSQTETRQAFAAITADLKRTHSDRQETQRELAQLLLDHREIMRCLSEEGRRHPQ